MKVTMYELLGMVKDGKIPKKIKYNDNIWEYIEEKENYKTSDGASLNWDYVALYCLKEPVEIIEEKKIPEKIETYKDRNNEIFLDDLCYKYMPIHKDSLSFNEQVIVDKLNDVIDYLKSKGE